jgi:alpha/beta superfamily hydrolase
MGKIFSGQSALRITLKTFIDLEGITTAVIKYRRPGGSAGEFAAGVGDAAKGVIFHECLEGEIDVSGWWSFWAFITFADGRTAAGEATKVFVWNEGG